MGNIDYSLYLVTDPQIRPVGSSIQKQVSDALAGGVTIVQLRDKSITPTNELLPLAKELKALCKAHNAKFIVNDRVDLAIACGADGVHVGQEDLDVDSVRKIVNKDDFIIGVSAGNVAEARKAVKDGADYIGIGAVFSTATKSDTGDAIGVVGVVEILEQIKDSQIPVVAIGGINALNARKVMLQCISSGKGLNGLAIVSALMNAQDAKSAAIELHGTVMESQIRSALQVPTLDLVFEAIRNLQSVHPLVHHMTNLVVINDNANATLAVGASPIMSTNIEETEDLSKVDGALVLNMGTLINADTMLAAAKHCNRRKVPVILDPVGAGATHFRRDAVKRFLSTAYYDIIKGNEGEILTLSGQSGSLMRGVDSTSNLDLETKARVVRSLATREKCIVVMTGIIDLITDGTHVLTLSNGHEFMGLITGSGCMAASLCGCFAGGAKQANGASKPNYFIAATAAMVILTLASERAAARTDVKGPGTFRSALIDELWNISSACKQGDEGKEILSKANLKSL